MTRPNENALTPASLATDGEQGEDAKAKGPCESQDNAQAMAAHSLACMAVETAQARLDAYALATHDPVPGTVEAADLLDAAAECLGQAADFSDARKGGKGGVA